MQYDTLFKSLFKSSLNSLIPRLTGLRAVEQLDVEFQSLERRVPDLVARLEDGRLLHVEVQTANDPRMPVRMLHYWVLLTLRYPKETIRQVVLYAGYPKLTMQQGLDAGGLSYHYDLVDLRDLEAKDFIASPLPAERALAILCRTPDVRKTIREVLLSWKGAAPKERTDLLLGLMVVSELRKLLITVKEEADKMAFDIEELVAEFERSAEKEFRKTVALRAQAALFQLQLEHRFGPLSQETEERIRWAKAAQIRRWSLRILDAKTLDAVFA